MIFKEISKMSEANIEAPYTMEIPLAQLLTSPSVNVIEFEEYYPEVSLITKSHERETRFSDMAPSALNLTRFVKTNQLWWRGPYERTSETIVCDRQEGCNISRGYSHTFSYSSSVS
jgi:hypothetical protein